MSTTPIETWAVDLKDITAIYPWVGSEVAMAWIGILLWLAWHVWQVKHENAFYKEKLEKYGDQATINGALDDHH
tara:strand:- start:414 stop:635 length:222 start_codon:yes stop_codon:yes gene_type:complete